MKNRIILILVVLCSNFIGCEEKKEGIFFGFQDSSQLFLDEYDFYEKDDGSVYLHLNKESERSILKIKKIESIELRVGDSIYKGKVIEAAFSKEMNLTPFICYTHNNGFVNFENIGEKELIFMGIKKDLKSLIENNTISFKHPPLRKE